MIRSYRYLEKAFALPTILIASVVMIIVMLASIQSVVSIRIGLDNQYYDKLAQEAGESGIKMAIACIESDQSNWVTPLSPGSDCLGNGGGGYILNTSGVRTSFRVAPLVGGDNAKQISTSTSVELLRTSNGLPWKSYSTNTQASITYPQLSISSGNDTTCATINGALYCWGKNESGEIGNNSTTNQLTPYRVQSGALAGKYVYTATSGHQHTCALAGDSPTNVAKSVTNSAVYCWGDNSLAQLGLGTTTNSPPYLQPVAAATNLPNGRIYTDISSSYNSCVIGKDPGSAYGRIWCWGANGSGQSGTLFPPDPKTTPWSGNLNANDYAIRWAVNNSATDSITNSSPYNDAIQIDTVSSGTACTVALSNKALCWGTNASGNMGIGTTSNTSLNNRWRARAAGATDINAPQTTSYRFTKVVTNFAKVCALGLNVSGATSATTGKIYCWGANGDNTTTTLDYRRSGDDSAYQTGVIADIAPSGTYNTARFKDVALSDWNGCGIRSDGADDGKVFCWGYNHRGQLGNGTISGYTPVPGAATPPANKPLGPLAMTQVTGLLSTRKAIKITSGNDHFCVMTISGSTYCWGANSYGQLGDGTTTDRSSPVRVKIQAKLLVF